MASSDIGLHFGCEHATALTRFKMKPHVSKHQSFIGNSPVTRVNSVTKDVGSHIVEKSLMKVHDANINTKYNLLACR